MDKNIDKVLSLIDKEEVANLAVALGQIYTPPGTEIQAADYIQKWLQNEGIDSSTLSLFPNRPNIVAVIKGTGSGYSLLFNSHMDVAPVLPEYFRDTKTPIVLTAWRKGDRAYGMSVVNDKGPMACFLCAAKAIKKSGISLKGDLILNPVSGEINFEAVDEYQPPQYMSKEVGTRYSVNHGVIADYAIVAEATRFNMAWVEAGKAFFKITVFGGAAMYTPFINRPYKPEENPNAVFQASRLVQRLEEWAFEYQKKNTYDCPGGTLIPKVCIGAIRGGAPFRPSTSPELCHIYVDCRTTPHQDSLALRKELEDLVSSMRIEAKVELYVFRPGFEAKNIERLSGALEQAHQKVFGAKPSKVVGPECSMWRDINIFNEVGVPSLTYGPATGAGAYGPASGTGSYGEQFSVTVDDMYKATQVYALTAINVCNQEKMLAK